MEVTSLKWIGYRNRSMHRDGIQALFVAGVIMGLYGCGSDDSSPATVGLQTDAGSQMEAGGTLGTDDMPVDDAGTTLSESTETPTGEINALAANALYLDEQTQCSTVGEDVSFSVKVRGADGAIRPETDSPISGFVTLVQIFGDSAELVSRSDDQIVLQLSRPDVIGITAETQTSSVTGYFSAIEADAPATVIQRKAVSGGCLYSLRMPDYCATVLSKNGEVTVGRDGVFIAVNGCELDNPSEIPVREIAVSEQ